MQYMSKDTGEVDCVWALAQDITGRKQNEQAIVRLDERLRNANRDLEGFTPAACHDLRAPVRAADDFVQILTKEWAKLDENDRKSG
jgi:light-regulated signal transduction histidine kinase (bacteriophytochrome)